MINLDNIEVEIKLEYTMKKKVNNIYLSQEEIDLLDNYNINYRTCKSLGDLIMQIQLSGLDCDVIDNLLDTLSERDYYENFNK